MSTTIHQFHLQRQGKSLKIDFTALHAAEYKCMENDNRSPKNGKRRKKANGEKSHGSQEENVSLRAEGSTWQEDAVQSQEEVKTKVPGFGRPKVEFSWETFDSLCLIQCTGEEIAAVLNVTMDILEKRCVETWGVTFAERYRVKSQFGKVSLRRRQYREAMEGGRMLKHLGEHWLEQRPKFDPNDGSPASVLVNWLQAQSKKKPDDAD